MKITLGLTLRNASMDDTDILMLLLPTFYRTPRFIISKPNRLQNLTTKGTWRAGTSQDQMAYAVFRSESEAKFVDLPSDLIRSKM